MIPGYHQGPPPARPAGKRPSLCPPNPGAGKPASRPPLLAIL